MYDRRTIHECITDKPGKAVRELGSDDRHGAMLGDLLWEQRVKAEILGLDCFGWRWSFPLPAGIEGQDRKAVAAAAVAEEPQKEWRDWESNRRQKQMVF